MHYRYKTKGTCAQFINFDINNGIVSNVSFEGGCNGNLKAISKLTDGMPAEKINEVLLGNTCGPRDTSCADQFAKAVMAAKAEEAAG
ncbi:MAG: TIGR03905 family TSCPD domain-containing protein [Lachnospiraceae bacterium]|nr:TIGR03905 family TSCPD domain-containing protein [Lachnospiraceae bacterium]MBP5184205.1 TIGR03905 family TSCPD domain-containing protein [Lachnospiraceae bacterium]